MARAWYAYNGVGDPFLISSYYFATVKPNCLNGYRGCAIYVPNGGPSPALLSANIRNYIANLAITFIPQPQGSPEVKFYVYGRN